MRLCLEVCAGSVTDCIIAEENGADRIELNSAVALGGLTPSIATVLRSKAIVSIPILTMVRCRPGGFNYTTQEFETMYEDARYLLQAGADGLVFGFLNSDATIDVTATKKMVDLCHASKREAIFHRAFDRVVDPYAAVEALIECGVDRILTSGLKQTAMKGASLINALNKQFGDQIQFCAGAGITPDNIQDLVVETGVIDFHGSFKTWFMDPTTKGPDVSYAYHKTGDYDGVCATKVRHARNNLDALSKEFIE